MSLFNIISIRNYFSNNLEIVNTLKSIHTRDNSSILVAKTNPEHTINHSKNSIITIMNSNNLLISDSLINDLADHEFISPSFIKVLINKYWQETIFLSKSNLISDKYTNQLKSDGISLYKGQYKKFLFNFTKALVAGRVNTYMNHMKTHSEDVMDVQYIWRKGMHFFLPNNLLRFGSSHNISKNQLSLIKKLQCNNFPLFTIVNNFNQLIVAEPADQLIINNSPLENLYQWYNSNVLRSLNQDSRPVYESLLFVNMQDALEYKNYIKQQYIKYRIYNDQDGLSIFSTTLNFYYKLINTSKYRVNFRLIPDLKELGNLVYKYQYSKNILFHDQQKYGKNYFQGQPIYIIQPVDGKSKDDNAVISIPYTYEMNLNNIKEKYNAIFMNYEVVLLAWKKFIANNPNYVLPNKPKVLVYNLQEFLKMHPYDGHLHLANRKMLLVPNKDSYQFIKLMSQKYNNSIYSNIYNYFIHLKIVSHRLMWSLTSRQPINWY